MSGHRLVALLLFRLAAAAGAGDSTAACAGGACRAGEEEEGAALLQSRSAQKRFEVEDEVEEDEEQMLRTSGGKGRTTTTTVPSGGKGRTTTTTTTTLPCKKNKAKKVCGNTQLYCFKDPSCSTDGGVGCNAGGVGQDCRFCGTGGGAPECPASLLEEEVDEDEEDEAEDEAEDEEEMLRTSGGKGRTTTTTTTTLPCKKNKAKKVCGNTELYCFKDPSCSTDGGVGCNAGGVGQDCRFCGTGGGAPECPASLLEEEEVDEDE